METKIMRVVQQSEAFAVQSQKAENGQTMKCNIMLQEMGGKYENQYVAAILGNLATNKFTPGDIVAATMRFSTREYNGAHYQDILVTDIKCLTPAPSREREPHPRPLSKREGSNYHKGRNISPQRLFTPISFGEGLGVRLFNPELNCGGYSMVKCTRFRCSSRKITRL